MGQPLEAWYSIVERNGNCRLQEAGFDSITNSVAQTLNASVKILKTLKDGAPRPPR